MRKLTALVVVLTAMTSCKKECYKFRCEQTSQYKNSIGTPIGGNVSLTSYEEYKCELTKKEADRYLIYLNGFYASIGQMNEDYKSLKSPYNRKNCYRENLNIFSENNNFIEFFLCIAFRDFISLKISNENKRC